MSDPRMMPWTIDQFFDWQTRQPERYELVSGFPIRMMAGARNVHNDIVINLLDELRARLRGGGCRPFNGDSSMYQPQEPDVLPSPQPSPAGSA